MDLAIIKIEMVDAELLSQSGCVESNMPDAGNSNTEWAGHDFPGRKRGLKSQNSNMSAFSTLSQRLRYLSKYLAGRFGNYSSQCAALCRSCCLQAGPRRR